MTRARVCRWVVGLALALPAAAMAEQAYTTTAVNLRAGPDTDYPLVRWVPEGTAVEVHGCLGDYRWCDVEVFGDRGWMSASYLVYPYQSSHVPIITYGAVIGLPLIGFTFDSYWDNYYSHRPWYGERQRWAYRHRPEFFAPPHRPPQFRPPQHRPPQFYPPGNRPPEFRPPQARPPQFNPPSARPPEFRPPQVQQQPMRPPQNQGRPPAYRPPDARSQQPGFRPPAVGSPAPAARPAGPPPNHRSGPSRGVPSTDDSRERGGMNTGRDS